MEITKLVEGGISAALAAGEELKKGYGKNFRVREKSSAHDLVTEYDQIAEDRIVSIISQKFPHHGIISEESTHKGSLSEEIIWCIDPLDGTWNFAHHIPTFSISIAALYRWEPVIGIIYHPLLAELFIAEKERGATLNGLPLCVSNVRTLAKAGLSFGFSLHAKENYPRIVNRIRDLTKQHVMMRRTGSAALDLAYVAAGRLDGYFEPSLNNWDIAAGLLMIKESRGIVTSIEGNPINLRKKSSILGANPFIHREMLKFFEHPKKYYGLK